MSSCEISREDFPFVETATFPVELIPSICSPPIAVKQEFTSTPAFCSASSIALRIAPEAASIFTMFPFRKPADFSQEVPGLYMYYGTAPCDQPLSEAKPTHHPEFRVAEQALKFATRLECNLLYDCLKNLE